MEFLLRASQPEDRGVVEAEAFRDIEVTVRNASTLKKCSIDLVGSVRRKCQKVLKRGQMADARFLGEAFSDRLDRNLALLSDSGFGQGSDKVCCKSDLDFKVVYRELYRFGLVITDRSLFFSPGGNSVVT